jgi:hypothetical protein
VTFCASDSRPVRTVPTKIVVVGRSVLGDLADPLLQTWRGGTAQDDPVAQLPRRASGLIATEPDELSIGVLADPAQHALPKHLQHRQPQLALERHRELGRRHDPALPDPLQQLGGRDVDDLKLVDRVDEPVVDERLRARTREPRPGWPGPRNGETYAKTAALVGAATKRNGASWRT